MLQGIRAIKFYNWETPFKERVERIHDDELSIFRKAVTKRSLVVSVLSTTPAIVIAVTLGLYRCQMFTIYNAVVFVEGGVGFGGGGGGGMWVFRLL